jgi:hypothetical protein
MLRGLAAAGGAVPEVPLIAEGALGPLRPGTGVLVLVRAGGIELNGLAHDGLVRKRLVVGHHALVGGLSPRHLRLEHPPGLDLGAELHPLGPSFRGEGPGRVDHLSWIGESTGQPVEPGEVVIVRVQDLDALAAPVARRGVGVGAEIVGEEVEDRDPDLLEVRVVAPEEQEAADGRLDLAAVRGGHGLGPVVPGRRLRVGHEDGNLEPARPGDRVVQPVEHLIDDRLRLGVEGVDASLDHGLVGEIRRVGELHDLGDLAVGALLEGGIGARAGVDVEVAADLVLLARRDVVVDVVLGAVRAGLLRVPRHELERRRWAGPGLPVVVGHDVGHPHDLGVALG